VLQCVAVLTVTNILGALIAVCCSVLQCVAAYCGVLQCVAVLTVNNILGAFMAVC